MVWTNFDSCFNVYPVHKYSHRRLEIDLCVQFLPGGKIMAKVSSPFVNMNVFPGRWAIRSTAGVSRRRKTPGALAHEWKDIPPFIPLFCVFSSENQERSVSLQRSSVRRYTACDLGVENIFFTFKSCKRTVVATFASPSASDWSYVPIQFATLIYHQSLPMHPCSTIPSSPPPPFMLPSFQTHLS